MFSKIHYQRFFDCRYLQIWHTGRSGAGNLLWKEHNIRYRIYACIDRNFLFLLGIQAKSLGAAYIPDTENCLKQNYFIMIFYIQPANLH